MATDTEQLLQEFSGLFTESEAASAKQVMKRARPVRQDSGYSSESEESLFESFKNLNKSGDIDLHDGDTKILELIAEKTGNKERGLKLIQDHRSHLPKPEKIVGRGKDMDKIHTFLSNVRVPGVNVFGESGVGKTTIAKEVSNKMKEFVTLSIDLRGTKDINSVYFKVLEAFGLARSDYSKERIYTHLQNLTSKTLLLLDNVEQFMAVENEDDQKLRSKFLEFLNSMIVTTACKTGHFKVLITSRIPIDEPKFRRAHFVEYKLESFNKNDSDDFINRRVKDSDADPRQKEAANSISEHCKGIIYLLRGAEQLKRALYSTSVQVSKKITAQIIKGVPEQFASINALFESLPSDHLRQVAVKISLLQRPFSVGTAMKITEMSSDYDSEFDLEMLAVRKIITAEDVKEERKYDVHDRFREFVTSYLCKEDPIYLEHLNEGKKKFSENFSDELMKLSEKLENDFVGMFTMLGENRPNFEKTIDIIIENASFDLLFYPDDLKKAGLIAMFFKYVVNNQKRKELFKSWSASSERKGKLLISAYIKCWEALLSADMEGIPRGFDTLNQAIILLNQAHGQPSNQRLLDMAQGMYLFCRGHLKYQECTNLTDQSSSKTKKMTKKLLHEALSDLEKSLDMHRRVYGDHSLTARSLDLIGNCYMWQFEPEKAESFYQDAMNMKLMLIGSDKHDDIVHYYNQLSQVHQMMGDKIMKGPFDLKKMMGPLLPYQKKAKQQYEMAASLLTVALALQEALGVCDTEDTATFQRNLANIHIALKKYDDALDYAKKSYKTRSRLLREHPETVRILYLIGIIHEWRKDHKAALQSYEEAFAMEESLPVDNHSVVRKLLCGRLEAMCKKLKKKDKLKEYGPRIKAIMQIKRSQSVTEEPAVQVLPAAGRRDDDLETAEEPATEEEVPGHPIQDDIPEETPVSYTGAGAQQGDLPDVPLPPDDSPVTPTEPGTADTEHPVPEDLGVRVVTGIMDEIPPRHFTINPGGGTLDIPRIGIRLDIPPDTVDEATTVMYQNYTTETLPVISPAGKGETIVSYIVGLELSTFQLNKPIFVNMMHSGPGKGCGYETIVKAYNQGSETWEELEVLDRGQESISAHCRRDYVGVKISKLTMLAVVTRLITDRFQVTPKGCVVRSSVCHDVIVEFPEGAVDKTIEGTMKLLPMPNNIYNLYNVYACPILSMKGFENVDLLGSVTIQMPHPCPTRYSTDQVRLVRLKNNEWQEIENPKMDLEDTYFKLQIQHFCWLWLMIPVGGTAVAVASAYKMFEYLSTPPQSAFIAASRDLEQPALQMKLHCLPNHKQDEFWGADRDEKKKYSIVLGASTVDELRPGETACTKIEGCFEANEEVYLKFLKNQKEAFLKLLILRRKPKSTETKEQLVHLVFYKEKSEDSPLCKFSIEEDMLDPKYQASAGSWRLGHDGRYEVTPIFNLSDQQKRWLVVGICLNKTLLPALRAFLKQELDKHYNNLKTKHNIDNQSNKKHLKKDGKHKLNYKSINKNKTKKRARRYDYDVKSTEDLGKLYLMPYMAKFTGFDDTCDLSAVLGILSSASVFSPDVQKLAKEVKNEVRNRWGHCNFLEWTDTKFTSCCQLMKSLVQALKLPEEDEKRITDEIGDWETKGVGADSFAKFIEFARAEIERLSEELKRLEADQNEQAEQIANLQEDLEASQEDEETPLASHKSLDETQEDEAEQIAAFSSIKEEDEKIAANLRSILETLVKDNIHRDEKIDDLSKRQKVLEQKQESYEKRIETVEQKVKDITSSTDEEPVECFGILITDGNFKDLPEDIIYTSPIITYIDGDIPGIEDGKWKPEKFLRKFPTQSIDIPRNECLQNLLGILQEQFQEAVPHIIELLSVGKVIVNTPLKENQDLAKKTVEIVSSNLNCCWETLAGQLNVHEDIVRRYKEDYSGDTPDVTSKMLRRWIETSDKSCTLEVVFDALRLCGDKKTGEQLATYTTEWIKKHCTGIAGKHI